MSQRDIVLRRLREAGEKGVSARTFIYEDGITRSAAIVYDLRQHEGFNIETLDEGSTDTDPRRKRLARYVLHEPEAPKRVPTPPPGLFDLPSEAKPVTFDCGCVRSADGKRWDTACRFHPQRAGVTV